MYCAAKYKKNASSKYKGVYWNKTLQRWVARIHRKHLGVFTSEIDAAKTYDRAAQDLAGDVAYKNF